MSDTARTTATVVVSLLLMAGISLLTGSRSVELFGVSAVALCAAAALGVQWLCWVPASLKETERFYDLTGGLTYLSIVGLSLWVGSREEAPSPREWILSGMVVVWAVRLASFLFLRIHRTGKDGRFDDLKTSAVRFLIPWTLQGLWVFSVSYTHLTLPTIYSV